MRIALVPALNEEKTIEEVIRSLRKHTDAKIIVVDDGSTDSTPRLVKKLGVTLVRHKVNKGKGEAIKTGINYILKNYPETKHIAVIDADMQYLPSDVNKLLKPLEDGKADFVTGYRNWRNMPFRHRLGNFVWRTAFNLLFGTDFKDTNCGVMALTLDVANKIKNILHGGYIIENTIFVGALKNNFRIKQVPVNVIYRRKSEIKRGIRVVLGVLLFILKEGIKYRLRIK